MKQLCVTSDSQTMFNNKCNVLLNDGWEVIPTTVCCAMSSSTMKGYNGDYIDTRQTLVAFFQKKISE